MIFGKLCEKDDKGTQDGLIASSEMKYNYSDLVVLDEFGKESDKGANPESMCGVGFDQAGAVDDNFDFMLPVEPVHEHDVVKKVRSKNSCVVRTNNIGLVVTGKLVTKGVKRSVMKSFGPDFFVHGNLDTRDGENPIGYGSKVNQLVGNSFSLGDYQDSWNDQIFPICSKTSGIGNEVVLLDKKIENNDGGNTS